MASCSVENEETYLNENTANLETPPDPDPIFCHLANLIAGQNMTIGTVSVNYDGSTITVVYETDGNWTLELTHLWIGDCTDLPVNNPGNPLIGQFPYSESHPGATTFTYEIDASTLDGIEFICVAAHAEVIGATSETAWAAGTTFPGNNWAMYFEIDCL
ncbi:MAG: hypothetical protein O6943_10395 [Bacteroidetes bacterium]|nr:hypothetical protein [Bacteroidota bacterium]